ncbi:hypothetical protein [Streptomyces adustus]
MSASRWQPGQTLGSSEEPDEYRLVQYIASGGEGELWKAVREDRYGHEEFHAVKILHSQYCASDESLQKWTQRWNDNFHDVLQLHNVPGLVRSRVVKGPQPHPKGRPGDDRGLYLIGAWATDASRLDDWARDCAAPPAERLRALVGLCETVDSLHRYGWVHRDISAGNVMVDSAGNTLLIDLTFLLRLNRAITVPIGTGGYADSDAEQRGGLPSVGKDRRAVGVLARVLLLPHEPISQGELSYVAAVAPGELADAGYSGAVIDCLMEVLGEHEYTRAQQLTDWGRRLVELVAAEPDRRQVCVAITVDARDRLVAVTGGDTGLRWHVPAGTDILPDSLPALGGGPRTVRDLVLVRDGHGRLVAAAVDGAGKLWIGTPSDGDAEGNGDGWQDPVADARGVAALVSPHGETLVWTATPDRLVMVGVPAEGYPRRRAVQTVAGSRVLGATWDAHGLPAVLVTGSDGVWHWTWPLGAAEPHRAQVCRVAAVGGSLALNRSWGELEAWVLGEDGVEHHLTRHHSGSSWEALSDLPATGGRMAMHSVHQGIVRVHAGPTGVALTMESSAPRVEQTLDGGAAGPLALHQSRDGAVHVAAVVDGRPRCWAESWSQDWVPVELRAL